MTSPAPTLYLDEHGVQRLFGRRTSYAFEARDGRGRQQLRLFCPAGHRVSLDGLPVAEQRPVKCTVVVAGGLQCGIVLQLLGGFEAVDGTRAVMAVEVTPDELHWMERQKITEVQEQLRYLGCLSQWTP